MSDILNWLSANWATVAEVTGALLAAASVVTAMTSTPTDDKVVSWIKRLLGYASLLTHKDAAGTLSLPGKAGDSPLMFERSRR